MVILQLPYNITTVVYSSSASYCNIDKMEICKINMKLLPVKALTFFFYAGWAGYNPYKSLFHKQLGLSPRQNGLIQAVDRIVGIFGQPVRFLSYTLVNNAWQVLPLEVLHGLSFALTIAALNAEAAILSPEGMVATTVGLTQAIYRGVGFTAGALLGGVAYNTYGPITTFRGMAIICVIVSVLYFPAMKLEAYCNQANSNKTSDENRHLMRSMPENENLPREKRRYCSTDDIFNHEID